MYIAISLVQSSHSVICNFIGANTRQEWKNCDLIITFPKFLMFPFLSMKHLWNLSAGSYYAIFCAEKSSQTTL